MRASERMQAEAERLEKLAAEIERNPLTRQFREQEQAATLAKRKAAAERLAELDREAAARIPPLIADLAEKEAEQKHHEERGRVLAAATLAARAALNRARLDFDGERRGAEVELLESYDPRIDEAILYFRKRLDYLRTPGRITNAAAGSKRNIFTMRKEVTVESNAEAVRTSLTHCRDAIKTLEGMKLSAEYDAEAVATLKAGMPKVDIYETFTTSKDMEKLIEPDDEFHRTAQEWNTLQALADKADEILKKPLALLQGKRSVTPPAAAPAPTKAPPAPPATPGPQNRAYLTRR